jgi:hypothetical protein
MKDRVYNCCSAGSRTTAQPLGPMIVTATLYAPLIASYNMPYQSLGAELTPGRGERTSVQTSVVRGRAHRPRPRAEFVGSL